MLRVALRGLLARKGRLALSAVAVVLGVAFVSGTYVLTDTLQRVFDGLFGTVASGTSVEVRSAQQLDGQQGPQRGPVPGSVLDRVREVEGVAAALGTVSAPLQLVGPGGEVVATGGAPTLGVDWTPDEELNPLDLREGEAPDAPGEVALDVGTAEREGLRPGDEVQLLTQRRPESAEVVGVFGFGEADDLAGAALVALEPSEAQRLLLAGDEWSALAVRAEEGVTDAALRDRVAAVLPEGVEAVTGEQSAADASADVGEGLGFFSTALLVFAGISLFVGAFIIFNTFSMLVAQRTRELALLRAVGASRRQVTGAVLLEALVVGLLSSGVGLLAGVGVAVGLRSGLSALGVDLPEGETVVATRTVVVALVVGVGVTAVAALVPARRAAAVPPVAALRESSPAEPTSLRRRSLLGAGLLAAGLAALLGGLASGALPLVGLGTAVAFLGVTALSPLLAGPVVGVLGRLARGVPGRLGAGNALRNPRRTSATASALMIGLGLVSAVSVVAASLQQSVVQAVEEQLQADLVLSTDAFGASGFTSALLDDVSGVDAVDAVAGIALAPAQVEGRPAQLLGSDVAALAEVLRLDVLEGDLRELGDGVALPRGDAEGLSLGDEVALTTVRGEQAVPLRAVYRVGEGDPLEGPLVDLDLFEELTGGGLVVQAFVRLDPEASADERARARTAVEEAAAAVPAVRVQDQSEVVAEARRSVDQLLNVIIALLVLSVVIALLGVVNTLALSVLERTRELGLLRAVGLQRRELRRMIRTESVLVCLYGGLLGVVVGTGLGYALVKALEDQGLTAFAVPWGRLLLVLAVAAVAGVVAAALPARRAARLDVLQAVSGS